jgi:signal transduction histidine kinase
MKHSRYIWIGFLLCLAVVLAAMGFISLTVLRLERAESEARCRAAWEENVRLALWRMDSVLGPLVAGESIRPWFTDNAFLPENVLVYFQFEPDGRLTSPQIPAGINLEPAVPNLVSAESVRRAKAQLDRVGSFVDREKLAAMLPPLTEQQRLAKLQRHRSDLKQRGRGAVEFQQRDEVVRQQANVMGMNQNIIRPDNPPTPSTNLGGVLMTPIWIDGNLILARRVTVGGREYVRGCLLDWPSLKASLLGTVEDLLPGADLEPVDTTEADEQEEARMSAALPIRLAAGEPTSADGYPVAAAGWASPIRFSLAVAWACFVLAAAAVAVLLAGVMRLAERREAFVSAVTHELRTPLTTFQMYAEMLAEGMVPEEQQRREYLATLRAEAVRLTHLVENVLCYARLERGRTAGHIESLTVEQLLEPIIRRLTEHTERAGMELIVEKEDAVDENVADGDAADGDAADGALVRANSSAVEQVLFNLVDNACKYAADAEDKRIHLSIHVAGGTARINIRDHGPGISPSARRRLFRPFSKSAHEAARTAPGVGLGLALSRRLARDMGGDLRLDQPVTDGVCFVLVLPTP